MITSEVIDKAASKNDYPKLMSGSRGLIVLFKSHGHGMVIQHNCTHKCGYYTDDWDMLQFTDFEGSINISNGSK